MARVVADSEPHHAGDGAAADVGVGTHVTASFVGRFVAAVASNPVDVIKMQVGNPRQFWAPPSTSRAAHVSFDPFGSYLDLRMSNLK